MNFFFILQLHKLCLIISISFLLFKILSKNIYDNVENIIKNFFFLDLSAPLIFGFLKNEIAFGNFKLAMR